MLLLAGCEDRDCTIETLLEDELGSASYADCGRFQAERTDDATYRAAHDCVVAAYAERRNFAVIWYLQGVEGLVRHAYVGVERDGEYRVIELVQGFNADASLTPTVTTACSELVVGGACDAVAQDLCVSCEGVATTCEP